MLQNIVTVFSVALLYERRKTLGGKHCLPERRNRSAEFSAPAEDSAVLPSHRLKN